MATTTPVKSPQALAETRRWAAPGSKSAALFAQAQGVMPGGNTRTTVYMAPYPPYAASGDGCWITDVEGDRRLERLSARERQVLQLIAEGHSTKAIAARLSISAKTVESHRSKLMQKLDIHDTASLVRYAIRHGVTQA